MNQYYIKSHRHPNANTHTHIPWLFTGDVEREMYKIPFLDATYKPEAPSTYCVRKYAATFMCVCVYDGLVLFISSVVCVRARVITKDVKRLAVPECARVLPQFRRVRHTTPKHVYLCHGQIAPRTYRCGRAQKIYAQELSTCQERTLYMR